MQHLAVRTFNHKHVSHSKRLRLLSVDASMLGMPPGYSFERLYADACDEGCALRNEKTGNITFWHLVEIVLMEASRDILCWKLQPTPNTIARNSELNGYELRVYND